MTYFGEFGYLNSSCLNKSITLMFLSSSRDEFTIFWQNSVTGVSVGIFLQFPINLGKKFPRISSIRKIAVT